MQRRTLYAAAAGLALLVAAPLAQAAESTVVVLQSLTGAAAFIGAPVKDGMVMAAEEINRDGFLGAGNTLKVIVQDDATDRAQTLTIINRMAADPSVLTIIGPTSGSVAEAGANLAQDLKIPLIATSNSLSILKVGPWPFILTQPGGLTIPYIADYATNVLKTKRCAVIGVKDNEAYVILQRLFETTVAKRGTEIVSVDGVKISDSDFSAIATKIAGEDIDCLFISAPGPQSANIVVQMKQAGLSEKVRILGHTSLASPEFISKGGAAVEGVYLIGDWAPGGNTENGKRFDANFRKKFNSAPDNWSAIGYGGMYVIATAIKNAGPNPTREAVRDALAKVKNVPVVVGGGTFSMDAERVPSTGMNLLTVKGGKFVIAPQ